MFFLMQFCPPQDLKHCSVVLDRLRADDKTVRKELEDKEDMNRKGGKPVSRIPTFHKRPTGASQSTELPAPKKDTPVHAAQPPEKPGSGGVEASKSKPPDVREKTLPVPSVRIPKIGFEAPSPYISTEQATAAAHSSIITAPKSWSLSESVQYSPMSVSPRPAIRTEQGSEQHLPERDKRKTFEIEADTIPDAPISHLPHEGSVSQKPPEDTEAKYDVEVKSRISLAASGDTEKWETAEIVHTAEVSQEEAIMKEEPPWETEPMNVLEFKDSRSSSDVEYEDDLAGEKSEGHHSGEVKEHHEPLIRESVLSSLAEERSGVDESTSPVAPEKTAKATSTKSTKVSCVALLP